jgi:hypothetical protein
MPDQSNLDRKNDAHLLTPLLLMGLIIAAGILLYAYAGHAVAAAG